MCLAFHHLKLPFHHLKLSLHHLAMAFGQLIFRKIIKIVAIRGQILRLNAPNSISISAGAPSQTPLGSLEHYPGPLLDLRRLSSNGRLRRKGKWKRRGEEKEREGRGGVSCYFRFKVRQ